MDEEIWKSVVGYELKYQVSNLGNIIYIGGYNQAKKRILKNSIDIVGYPRIIVYTKGKPQLKRIHRLVAQAFIPNLDNKPEVNHKNGIKTDNRVENLEWVTHKENIQHARTYLGWINGEKQRNSTSKVNSKKICQYSKLGILMKKFISTTVASIETGISRTAISNACNGYSKTAGGFTWKNKFIL